MHLGNYFGAVRNWVEIQEREDRQLIASVVDLHAITVPWDKTNLSQNITTMMIELLACGLDPNRSILFCQSRVAEHTELAWILSCISTMGRLDNLPQYREKSKEMREIPCGLFLYPVLQAADILLYRSNLVPVGDDNLHHLQLCQNIAKTFNRITKTKYFPIPEIIPGHAPRLLSLQTPAKKMSKSEANWKSRIEMRDSFSEIHQKIRRAVTDTHSDMWFDPEARPGVSNLLTIHSLIRNQSVEDSVNDVKGMDTLAFKTHLVDVIISFLEPIQKEIARLEDNLDYVEKVYEEGAEKARQEAVKTMKDVRELIGIGRFFEGELVKKGEGSG